MKPHRASAHPCKNSTAAQSAKTTSPASENPVDSSRKNPDRIARAIEIFRRLDFFNEMEQAMQKAGAMLEFFRCKLVTDDDDGGWSINGLPGYDAARTQQLCGTIGLIIDAEKSLQTAYTASNTLHEELRQLAENQL